MQRRIGGLVLGQLAVIAIASSALAAETGAVQAGQERVVVLDTTGFWRLHHTLKPPVIQFDDGPKPVLLNQRWLNAETPEPPADWRTLEFDDSRWLRGPARIACKTAFLSRLCMRGKFKVTDPAKVQDLSLTLAYQGGAIVYLNGKEITRAHLSSAKDATPDSAKPYPLEAYLTETGGLLPARNWRQETSEERLRRYALRERTLSQVVIPGPLLRKGTNVLAIEIVRAPYHKVVDQKKGTLDSNWKRHGFPIDFCFNSCEFNRVQLTAASGDGLLPNATRPQGFQVWSSNLMASDYDLDFGDACEPLMPIRIVGARNGSFSGKVVVGSTRVIKGLKVVATDLKGDGGTIPASAVQVRYSTAWGRESGVWGLAFGYTDVKHWRYPREMSLLGALAEAPLAEFPVRTKQPSSNDLIDLCVAKVT